MEPKANEVFMPLRAEERPEDPKETAGATKLPELPVEAVGAVPDDPEAVGEEPEPVPAVEPEPVEPVGDPLEDVPLVEDPPPPPEVVEVLEVLDVTAKQAMEEELETWAVPAGQVCFPLEEVTGATGDKVGAVADPPVQAELVPEVKLSV
ncbi:MAG: hypothetical protein ACYCSH_08770 [Acidithiobacillus sp.]